PTLRACFRVFGLKPGMEVIDLCSGDGWFTLQIARIARHVAAIDIDPTLLEVARVRLMEAGVTTAALLSAMLTISRGCGLSRSIWSLWRTPFTACRMLRDWRRQLKRHLSRADVSRSSIGMPARARKRQSWVRRAARKQNCG